MLIDSIDKKKSIIKEPQLLDSSSAEIALRPPKILSSSPHSTLQVHHNGNLKMQFYSRNDGGEAEHLHWSFTNSMEPVTSTIDILVS